MYCPNCGTEMPDNSTFCSYCETPLRLSEENEAHRGHEATPVKANSPSALRRSKPGSVRRIVPLCLAAALLTACVVISLLWNRKKALSEPAYWEPPAEESGNAAVVLIDPTPAATETPKRAEPSAVSVWIEASTPAPFYGIWCTGSKDQGVAEKNRARFAEAGLDARVFVTTDWSNLNSEKYYVVTAGTYSSYSEAEAMLPTVKAVVKDAYIKYSGDWKGATNPDVPFGASTFTGWLGSYSQRSFAGAYASSEFVEGNIRYIASYAIDDGINRPWVEGVSGSGIGETLTLYFPSETTVSVIDLRLGYARDSKRYYGNNRPSLLRFSFSDGSSFDCAFQDVMADQAILLSRPVSTTYIEITILDVYYGTDNDTCIYLVKAYG